jgi:hypothetical protein
MRGEMLLPSMSSQCPVKTQMATMDTARPNETISAAVNRPHAPNDILEELNRETKIHSYVIRFNHEFQNGLPNIVPAKM